MASILVTGANGQVGQELQFLASQYPDFQFTFTDVSQLDITDEKGVIDLFQKNKFDYCLNCAAYTAVDKAESDEELAEKINTLGVKHLAQACLLHNTPLIQLSTDYVYHNDQNTPFKEGDPTNPQGVYAKTKLDGDEIALKVHPYAMVLRTSWVYSAYGNNFVKTMIRLGTERDQLGIIFDQIGSPTYARDLADAMLTIITKVEKGAIERGQLGGVFHYSNEGVTSWYDFAMAIFDLEGITCNVKPIETTAYPTPAKRPPFSLLNKGKIKSTFDITIPYWRDSLKSCLAVIKQNMPT